MKYIVKYIFQILYVVLEIIVRYAYIGPLIYFFVFVWTFSRKSAETQWKEFQRGFDTMPKNERIGCALGVTGITLFFVGLIWLAIQDFGAPPA